MEVKVGEDFKSTSYKDGILGDFIAATVRTRLSYISTIRLDEARCG